MSPHPCWADTSMLNHLVQSHLTYTHTDGAVTLKLGDKEWSRQMLKVCVPKIPPDTQMCTCVLCNFKLISNRFPKEKTALRYQTKSSQCALRNLSHGCSKKKRKQNKPPNFNFAQKWKHNVDIQYSQEFTNTKINAGIKRSSRKRKVWLSLRVHANPPGLQKHLCKFQLRSIEQ